MQVSLRNQVCLFAGTILGLAAASSAFRGTPRVITLLLAGGFGAVLVFTAVGVIYSESARRKKKEAAAAAGGRPVDDIVLVVYGNPGEGAAGVVGADGQRTAAGGI